MNEKKISHEEYSIKRWAFRWALVRVACLMRSAYQEEQTAPTRKDLRTRLETLRNHANAMRIALDNADIIKALALARAVRDEEDDPPEVMSALDKIGRVLNDGPNILDALAISAGAAISKLGLKGQHGAATAWSNFFLPAKQRLAVYGIELFVEARHLPRKPNHNNTALASFLELLWACATDSDTDENWSGIILAARLKRSRRREAGLPHISALTDAHDLFVEMTNAERVYRMARRRRLGTLTSTP